jgi:hypothetical protein
MKKVAAIAFVRRGVMVVHCVCLLHSVCGFCPGFMMAGFSHMPSANAGVFFSRSFSCSYEQRNPDSTVSTTFIDFALEVQLVFPLSRPRRMLSLSNELLPMKTLAH